MMDQQYGDDFSWTAINAKHKSRREKEQDAKTTKIVKSTNI